MKNEIRNLLENYHYILVQKLQKLDPEQNGEREFTMKEIRRIDKILNDLSWDK